MGGSYNEALKVPKTTILRYLAFADIEQDVIRKSQPDAKPQ